MQANTTLRIVKWIYFTILLAGAAFAAWAIRPLFEEQSARRSAALTVEVYAHPFVSVLKDTAISRGSATSDFFTQDVFKDAVTAIMDRQAPPFAKGADRDAWTRDFVSELTGTMNSFMARRYVDSLQRFGVANDAKGLVLVRVANVSKTPVEEIRVEVTGGQMFMDGSPAAPKFRSLGTRALRFGTLAPGEKSDLFVLTTEDMSPGASGPKVKVTAKDVSFPVAVHALDAPARPTPEDLKWIAFAVIYAALILAGLGVKMFSFLGPAPSQQAAKISSRVASAPAASMPVFQPPANPAAWRRPER
ncbi:MAG: hypothetical protein K1X51_12515 [Rhodospirillaceae bacterium]|nr:hypothetical protein [Rhodospirillaceae bacterium]